MKPVGSRFSYMLKLWMRTPETRVYHMPRCVPVVDIEEEVGSRFLFDLVFGMNSA